MKKIYVYLLFLLLMFSGTFAQTKLWSKPFGHYSNSIVKDFDGNIVKVEGNKFVVIDYHNDFVKEYKTKYSSMSKLKKVSDGFVVIADNKVVKFSKHYDFVWEVPFKMVYEIVPFLVKKMYSNVDTISAVPVNFVEMKDGRLLTLCDSAGVGKLVRITVSGDIDYIQTIRLENKHLDGINILKLDDGYVVGLNASFGMTASLFYLFKFSEDLSLVQQKSFDSYESLISMASNGANVVALTRHNDMIYLANYIPSDNNMGYILRFDSSLNIDLASKNNKNLTLKSCVDNGFYVSSYDGSEKKFSKYDFDNNFLFELPIDSYNPYCLEKNDSIFVSLDSNLVLFDFSSSVYKSSTKKMFDFGVYPNPFNPATTISFVLPNKEFCDINLYNSTGQLVKKMGSSIYMKGENNIRLSGADLSSGVYFVRFKSTQFSGVRKIILLK